MARGMAMTISSAACETTLGVTWLELLLFTGYIPEVADMLGVSLYSSGGGRVVSEVMSCWAVVYLRACPGAPPCLPTDGLACCSWPSTAGVKQTQVLP